MPTMSDRPSAILDFALTSPADTIIVATEPHIIHQMEKAAPHKTFIGAPGGDGNCNCNMCPYMALNTLEKLYVALRDLEPRIELSPEVMDAARVPLERMLEMAGRTVGQGDVGQARSSNDAQARSTPASAATDKTSQRRLATALTPRRWPRLPVDDGASEKRVRGRSPELATHRHSPEASRSPPVTIPTCDFAFFRRASGARGYSAAGMTGDDCRIASFAALPGVERLAGT